MMFKLENTKYGKFTHAGVLEFSGEEGRVYVPYWMMEQNLLATEGDYITVRSAKLKVGSYVKFIPQSVDFLDITNQKAVLEHALRNFSCVTKGDVIRITYDSHAYDLEVNDVKPDPQVSIVEADVEVDFGEPRGYKEWLAEKQAQAGLSSTTTSSSADDSTASSQNQSSSTDGKKKDSANDGGEEDQDEDEVVVNPFKVKSFVGSGYRLDGKGSTSASTSTSSSGKGKEKVSSSSSSSNSNSSLAAAAAARRRISNKEISKTKSGTKGDDYWANLGGGNSLK
eukprot:TRINITY_DN1632_c0_g1_i2.p2 TRINITY_DN1632_c0_g1~~TRINITY_DN1632_c0_g1_i2.p2  ORF type:complete len:282 (-),score=95.16 TRINITY_DN1632_c0_g1_i2:935-1780(-)